MDVWESLVVRAEIGSWKNLLRHEGEIGYLGMWISFRVCVGL
jgi:hypothetical protein